MHAITSYPTHPENVNLEAITTLKREFPVLAVGYSDHTIGTNACICAAAMGAQVVEKHFTYDKNAEGPDHQLSATPEEMKYIVEVVRELEVMKGDGVKRPVGKEIQNRLNNRKSITAIQSIKKGETISKENIAILRPGGGIAPKHLSEVLGSVAARDIEEDETIKMEDLA